MTVQAPNFTLPDIPALHSTRVVVVRNTNATNIHSGRAYDTLSLADVLTIERTNVPKASAQFIIGSSYNDSDARVHSAQRERGVFHMLYADLDSGNVTDKTLNASVQRFVGNALYRIYSSSRATQDNRKWRVIVPLASGFAYDEWRRMQVAFFRFLEADLGVELDYALVRAAQPVYLPNTQPRTDGTASLYVNRVAGAVLLEFFSKDHAVKLYADYDDELAQEEARHAEQIKSARERMERQRAASGGQQTVIEAFNAAHEVEDMLTACGYKQKGHGWRSKYQTTDSFATKVFNDGQRQFWVSRSESDLANGVGRPARSGGCSGDAFDLFTHYDHAGDQAEAIKDAARLLGMELQNNEQIFTEMAARIRANTLARAAQYRQDNNLPEPKGVAQTPFDAKLMQDAQDLDAAIEVAKQEHWPEVRLDLRKVPAVRWLIDDCIAHSLMTVAGAPGTGKTTVLLSLLLTVAGFKVADINVETIIKSTTRRKVIVVSEDLEQVQRSLAGYCKRFGFDPTEVNDWIITIPAKRSSPEEILRLAANVERHTVIHPKGFPVAPLLVLDTASATWDLENENDNSEVGKFVSAVKETLHNILDAPILVVTHTPKTSNQSVEDVDSRGASAFRGDFRTTGVVFGLKESPDMRHFKLLKKRFEPLYEEISFRSEVLDEYAVDENGNAQIVRCRIAIPMPMTAEDRKQNAAKAAEAQHGQFVEALAVKCTKAIAEDMEKRGATKAFMFVGQAINKKEAQQLMAEGWEQYDNEFVRSIVRSKDRHAEIKMALEGLAGWEKRGGFLRFTLSRWQLVGSEFRG